MRTYFVHGSNWVSTLLLALATGTLAQNLSSPGGLGNPGTLCTSDDIANVDVAKCVCPSKFPPLGSNTCLGMGGHRYSQSCNPPPGGSVSPQYDVKTGGGVGCVDANNECNACYIWFGGLCNCLKDLSTGTSKCIPSFKISSASKTSPVWVVNAAHNLITTTQRTPGILELGTIPKYQQGFDFAQTTVKNMFPKTGTLAVNSVTSRTEEQIHIHLCDNTNTNLRDALSKLNTASYSKLSPVTGAGVAMQCRVANNKGDNIDQAGDVTTYLAKLAATDCGRYHVGSGYMVDNNGYSWSCVTIGGSAEYIFCKT
ncbi:hypothetical protein N7486_004172 [Penicillium sp. IBT 16267x]|nr:hypothetical protein N7486_004172 [Penicillium sp. IBT 16267x]